MSMVSSLSPSKQVKGLKKELEKVFLVFED
jgi:hypothetical protein